MPSPTLAEVDALAARAHAGQHDRIGAPYIEHVRAVAAGVAAFGTGLQMAALLHDVLEDTPTRPDDLLAAGIPTGVVATVRKVTREPGTDYRAMLLDIVTDQAAALVKIADNAHNSRADRSAQLPEADRVRLAERYRDARAVLWPAVAEADLRTVLATVNPALLAELD
ncbi:HD domain-containing protein [Kitasatospora sp. NPDC059673]|uniref:HD domain-containing protein n=1 Tax=Kitasatospora sp. NPDC059673 TaxID=3346901 RepID=UPI0036AB6392